jgi:hypothetical protein
MDARARLYPPVHRDVRSPRGRRQQGPEGRGGAVAECGVLAHRQHGGEPAPFDAQQPAPNDAVDTAVEPVHPPRGKARVQLVRAHAEPGQLRPRDHAVLALRELRHRPVELTRSTFSCHNQRKVERMEISPPSSRRVRPSLGITNKRSNA